MACCINRPGHAPGGKPPFQKKYFYRQAFRFYNPDTLQKIPPRTRYKRTAPAFLTADVNVFFRDSENNRPSLNVRSQGSQKATD